MTLIRRTYYLFCLGIGLMISTGTGAAQQCLGFPGNARAAERFTLPVDGTVVDRQTHLVWQRCSVGQKLNAENGRCDGEARAVTWFQAKQWERENANIETHWRLPTIYELSSITDLRCVQPAIDLQRFPNTPASHFWSATPFMNKSGHYWLVQFFSGENHTNAGDQPAFVRWVKTR